MPGGSSSSSVSGGLTAEQQARVKANLERARELKRRKRGGGHFKTPAPSTTSSKTPAAKPSLSPANENVANAADAPAQRQPLPASHAMVHALPSGEDVAALLQQAAVIGRPVIIAFTATCGAVVCGLS